MACLLRDIADLLRMLDGAPRGTGTMDAALENLCPCEPLLLLLAESDGKLIAAEQFGAALGPQAISTLAAGLARRLAQREASALEVPGEAGPRVALGLRVGDRNGGKILACLLRSDQLPSGPLGETRVGSLVCGAYAWATLRSKVAGLKVATRLRHCQAERDTLKTSYAQSIVAFLEEREERRRKQEENAALESLARAAEAANRAKSEFLANASHELRTPLTAILGYADLLADPQLAEEKRREYVETVRRNGRILLDVINDILDLSKVEAGKLSVEPAECSPWEIVGDVKTLMQVRAADAGLSLDVSYVLPLPRTVRTDPLRLRQILTNLVGNAIKFTDHGGVRIVARLVQADAAPPRLEFEVADSGIGIPRDVIGRLFEPFVQADASPCRRYSGTGLGLAISRRLAKLLGGDITVESTPGQGSRFSLTIDPGPLDGGAMLAAPPQPAGGGPETPQAEEQPPLCGRVLLAEDGRDNQRLIGLILTKAGLQVDVAENGRVVLERVAAATAAGQTYHLILMDMQMPEMDGYEAVRRLRQAGWGGPILALTAHALSSDRQLCLDAGCDDYLSKPIRREAFLATVGRHLAVGQPSRGR